MGRATVRTGTLPLLTALLVLPVICPADLEKDFASPPPATMPRCYWYWIDGRISKEGITRDLEAMRRVGIGEGYIGIIKGGEVKALTEEWWQLIEHAIREGGRLGVDVGLFNCPGWSQSGGPWVKPEQAMRYVVLPETRLRGPQRFEGRLPRPGDDFQDIAVLAFPAPAGDAETAETRGAKVTRIPTAATWEFTESFIARSLTVTPVTQVNVKAELQASEDGLSFRAVRAFAIDRHNLGISVGPVPLAPITVAFPATTARVFRLAFSAPCEWGELRLSPAARVDSVAEKSLAKVFQDPQPPFDFYAWPRQAEPESPELAIKADAVQDISRCLAADGTLRWDVPAGEWIVLRAGMRPTGTKNGPAPDEATGLEVDKMNREALNSHFDAYVGYLLRRLPAADRKAFKHVVADSYEMGPQNWTDGLAADFQKRYGYDPLRFLPAMTGRVVGSADESNRFLWDLRRIVADRVASDYVGALRDRCRANGLKMWLENYGHWGFPGEFLLYGGSCDEVSGEFWATGTLGSIELRDAASAAHIYGLTPVYAEAFTGGPLFTSHPGSLKARGDWSLCEGINQFVLHVYIHQPDERRPGVNEWFGTEFNRHNTWFEMSKAWIDYHRRCTVLLQHGRYVADVAYFIGEDAPKMAGLRKPDLPPGYSFDYINADVIRNRLSVRDGRFVLPDGMSYRLLVLPESETMRPAVLGKVRDLVAAGGAVLGAPPSRSPSLEDYPRCDAEVSRLASELWGPCDGTNRMSAPFGRGRVFRGIDVQGALDQLKTPPDLSGVDPARILFAHRASPEADVYFLSNQDARSVVIRPSFRVSGRAPELWNAENGAIHRPAVYEAVGETVRVPIRLDPAGSVFVVFREKADEQRVVSVTRDGRPWLDASAPAVPADGASTTPGSFTMALWAKPSDGTTMPQETNQGVVGIHDRRNDVMGAQHGDSIVAGGGHAGCGLAIGTNGVCVFEHGANYFVPVLVHAAPLTDWTHVAVVYRDRQPTLYLNGVKARTGLRSGRIPHPSADDAPGGGSFRGERSALETDRRALDAEAVARLMRSMPRAPFAEEMPPIELARAGGRIEALATQAGEYALKRADGRTAGLSVSAAPAPLAVAGPWEVSFPADSGVAGPLRLERLASWTEHADPRVRYFSGVAEYRAALDLPADRLAGGRALWLDLGRVEVMAEVTLNGQDLGTLWKAPYRLDITRAAKPGINQIRLRVANVWHNRIVGELREPAAFAAHGMFRPWVSGPKGAKADDPLFPSGLIGPVILRSATRTVAP